jgi:hypothetical protein
MLEILRRYRNYPTEKYFHPCSRRSIVSSRRASSRHCKGTSQFRHQQSMRRTSGVESLAWNQEEYVKQLNCEGAYPLGHQCDCCLQLAQRCLECRILLFRRNEKRSMAHTRSVTGECPVGGVKDRVSEITRFASLEKSKEQE